MNGEHGDDENKKKHVPLWIKQELERIETDKAKKAEREKSRFDSSNNRHSYGEENHSNVSNDQPETRPPVSTRRYFDVPDERYGKYSDRNDNRDYSRRRSRSHLSRSRSRSPGSDTGPGFDLRQKINEAHRKRSPSPILTEEEREAKLLKRTKVMLTEILLSVTNEEIESVAREVYDRAKRKERPKAREDFRIAYDRSDSESRGSPPRHSESEESDYSRGRAQKSRSRNYSERAESQPLRNDPNVTTRNVSPINSRKWDELPNRNQQPELSRLSPSVLERFQTKEKSNSPEQLKATDSSRSKREKRASPSPVKDRTPKRKSEHRTASKSDRKRQRSTRSRSSETRQASSSKKADKNREYEQSYDSKDHHRREKNRNESPRDRSRTPDKKSSSSKDKLKKSLSRSENDRNYVEESNSKSERKRSSRKETRVSRSRSKSRSRSPRNSSRSEKKSKNRKSYRDESRSRSRDKSYDSRYSNDDERESSSKKSKKKKKK